MHVLTLVVHPVDTDAHPTYPTGWRWAVMADTSDWADMRRCANAGHEVQERDAQLAGSMNLATAVMAARMLLSDHPGTPVRSQILRLDHDPIPAGVEATKTL